MEETTACDVIPFFGHAIGDRIGEYANADFGDKQTFDQSSE